MTQENSEKKLKRIEDSLIDSVHSFVNFAKLSSSSVESLYLLLDNLYHHGLVCADTNSKNNMINRLQYKVKTYS